MLTVGIFKNLVEWAFYIISYLYLYSDTRGRGYRVFAVPVSGFRSALIRQEKAPENKKIKKF